MAVVALMNRDDLAERVYQSVREASVLLDDGDRRAMREVGLTPAHYTILCLLDACPDKAAGHTITRLAELMLCSRGNATRLVQRMAEAGLVESRSDPGDQRLVRVVLTESGAERLAAARQAHAQLNAARMADLSDTDLVKLSRLLTALTQYLRKHLAQH